LFKKKKDKIRKSGLKLNGGNKRWGPFAARFVRGINKRKYNKQSEEIKKKKKKERCGPNEMKNKENKEKSFVFPSLFKDKKISYKSICSQMLQINLINL
jgi:hypothetical protein